MKPVLCALTAALSLSLAAGSAHAQVVINEVYSNPPGSGGAADDRWEYIEIYGPAGMNLTGYMVASVFGGGDPNNNDLPGPNPGWDVGDEVPEIDEAWTLDGLTIGSNGILVIYNNNGAGANRPSFLPPLFAPGTASATFIATHLPTGDGAGRIKNDGSATFVIVRKRPFHAVNASGISVYDGVAGNTIVSGPLTYPSAIRYAWRKDINPDVNFNGRIDFNGSAPLTNGSGNRPAETPLQSESAAPPVGAPSTLEPYQMVDDVAWSNGGGKEYVRSSQQEISDTVNFNPDAVSRINYFNTNPARGHVFVDGIMKPSRMADEEFVYGDIIDNPPLLSYNATLAGGPTSLTSQRYNAAGQLDPNGDFRLDDINLTGFMMTPGSFNDVNATSSGGINIVQQRFVRGDFNFDGQVNCDDKNLIEAAVGMGLDDMALLTEDNNTVLNTADDVSYQGWKFQGRDFNRLLAMVRMSLTDGTTGEWNSGKSVTAADVAAFRDILTANCCPADVGSQGGVAGADGQLNNNDFAAFITLFFSNDPRADVGSQGGVLGADQNFDNNDFAAFITLFFQGC
jgi:hypothetical protein